MLRKASAVMLFLFVVGAIGVSAQEMDRGMHMLESVTGIASDADAQRHFLLHAAHFADPNATDPISVNALAFKKWFLNAIDGFNATQATLSDADAATAMTSFLSQRDAQVSYYMGQLTAKMQPREKQQLYASIKEMQSRMKSGISQADYKKLKQLTKAEIQSSSASGGGISPGNYNCSTQVITCKATYSISGSITSPLGPGPADTFSRVNGGVGANWTTITGAFAISNNAVVVTSGGSGGTAMMYNNKTSNLTDQYVQARVAVIPSTNAGISAAARMSTDGQNLYEISFYNGSSCHCFFVDKLHNGALTHLMIIGWNPTVGDVGALLVRGNLLSAFLDGEKVMELRDNDIASGYEGITGTMNGGAINNWSGGADGDTTTFNPLIEGNQTMQPGHGNPIHTPSTAMSINGVQTTQNGTGVCGNCYFYADGDFTVPFVTGVPISIGDGAILTCSVVGRFF